MTTDSCSDDGIAAISLGTRRALPLQVTATVADAPAGGNALVPPRATFRDQVRRRRGRGARRRRSARSGDHHPTGARTRVTAAFTQGGMQDDDD